MAGEMAVRPPETMTLSRYVLLTAAYNEETFIARTLEAVLSQTILPVKWVIASDGSTDGTNQIVESYCARYGFIQLLPIQRNAAATIRGVVSKVHALKAAHAQLAGLEYEFIGNVDGDLAFGPDYFENLLARLQNDPGLGIVGGWICEQRGGEFKGRLSNSRSSVAHGAQLMRRTCYEAIGGYQPLPYGGEDWYAELNIRMRGWRVESFPALTVCHYRPTGAADRLLPHRFREGKMDYSFGSHPVFEALKCLRRVLEKPMVIGAAARFVGFCWSYVCCAPRLVPPEVAAYLRQVQKERLKLT
jgi:glycosyltransferase involved in cell wall biosynthesis